MEELNIEAEHVVLAQLISKHVTSVEEVNFDKTALRNKLANDMKKKSDSKLRYKLKSLWKTCPSLRAEVARILRDKASTSCKGANRNAGTEVGDDSTNGQSMVSEAPIVDLASTITESVQRDDTSITSGVIEEEEPLSISESKYPHDLEISNANIDVPVDIQCDELPVERMSGVCDSQLCDSITTSPRRRQISTREIENGTPEMVTRIANSSIYDFSDGEEEMDEDKENQSPNTSLPHPQKPKNKYTVDLGKVHPFSMQFKDTSTGCITNDAIRKGLANVLAVEYGGTCSLRFHTIRFNETDCVAYAKCRSAEHTQHFKFTVMDLKELIATVFASSSAKISFQHKDPIFAQLRGAEREKIRTALKTRTPRDYQMEVAVNIDPALAADGNMQELRRLYIYQKAKSEENCKNDLLLKSGDLSDLTQLWIVQNNEKDPYLRHVSVPLTAIMFTEAQLNLLDRSKGIILHFDATGSVVRKPQPVDCKRIYYYVIVTKHGESVIPLAEMVTSEHNILSISKFLKEYKFFVQEKWNTWPFVSAIVVDWSWALLNSIFFEWNQMSVGEYLNVAYIYVTQGRKPKNIVIVQTCCAHFMKRMSTIIKKDFSQYERIKSFLLECIAVMMLCRKMKELGTVFEHFVKVVSTPDADDARSSLRALGQIVQERQVELKEIAHESQDDPNDEEDKLEKQKPKADPASLKKSKAVFANSPFFGYFETKLREVEGEINKEKPITNKYHVPGFARHMTWKHLPYAPIWTGLMLDLVDDKISRLSNAYVESYHRVIKHQVLNHAKNLKIGHFVRKTETYTRSLVAEAKLEVSLKTSQTNKKPKYPRTVKTNVKATAKSEGCDIVPVNLAAGNVHQEVLSQEKAPDPQQSEQQEMDFENVGPDEASDPLVGETWKDTKRNVRGRGHFEGNVIGHLLDRINKKAPRNKHISEKASTPTEKVEEKVKESELATADCNDSENCDIALATSSIVRNLTILDNGLFSDVSYYMQSKSHNVRVGCFIATTNPPIRSNCFQLTARQFHTLTPNRWIDGLVIDCYSMTHIDTWINGMYLSTDDTGGILGNNWELRKPTYCGIYNISRTLSGRIFMPYVYNGHWRLLVVDVDEKTLTLLDPYERTHDQGRVIKAFRGFLSASHRTSTTSTLRKVQWEVKDEIVRPYQHPDDTTNCGAYVTYYVECLSKNEPFDLAFDPVQFREHMAKTLIEKSQSVKDMCLYCFGKPYGNPVTVCGACRNWCHTNCVERGEYDSEKEEDEDDHINRFKKRARNPTTGPVTTIKTNCTNVGYVCKLCRRNNKS